MRVNRRVNKKKKKERVLRRLPPMPASTLGQRRARKIALAYSKELSVLIG
jgi:hypothetical protein